MNFLTVLKNSKNKAVFVIDLNLAWQPTWFLDCAFLWIDELAEVEGRLKEKRDEISITQLCYI